MKLSHIAIPEVLLIEPRIFSDERDLPFEKFNQQSFGKAVGLSSTDERYLPWSDSFIVIKWPTHPSFELTLSDKDRVGLSLDKMEIFS